MFRNKKQFLSYLSFLLSYLANNLYCTNFVQEDKKNYQKSKERKHKKLNHDLLI